MNRLLNWLHRRRVARRLAAIVSGEHECNAIQLPLRSRLAAAPGRRCKLGGLLDTPAPAPAPPAADAMFAAYASARQALSQAEQARQDLAASTALADALLDALQVLYAVHHGHDPDRYELLARFAIDMDADDCWRMPLRAAARRHAADVIASVTGINPAGRVPHSGIAGFHTVKSTATPAEARP